MIRFITKMAPMGTMYPLTVTTGQLSVDHYLLVSKEIKIQGSCSSSREEVETMLQFVARTGIKPIIEEFPMTVDGITKAVEKLNNGNIRYRAVLTV